MTLFLLISGIILTGATAIIQYLQSEASEKEAKENEKALHLKVEALTKENRAYRIENIELSKKNTEILTKKLDQATLGINASSLNNNLGGWKVNPQIFPLNDYEFTILIENDDIKPIYSPLMTVLDIDALRSCQVIEESETEIDFAGSCSDKFAFQIHPSEINTGIVYNLQKKYILDKSYRNFQIEINSRKRHIIIQFVVYRHHGKWNSFYRILDFNNFPTLIIDYYGQVDKKYWLESFFQNKQIKFISGI